MQGDATVNEDTRDSSLIMEATEEDMSDTTTLQAAAFVSQTGDHGYNVPQNLRQKSWRVLENALRNRGNV